MNDSSNAAFGAVTTDVGSRPAGATSGVIPLAGGLSILALDLGTTTGWAISYEGSHKLLASGSQSFKPTRFEGAGMRFLKFKRWLTEMKGAGLSAVYFEEVRRHMGVDAAHAYGGFMGVLTAWCEHHQIPYQGVPVGTIKKHATGKGNADKDAMIAAARALGYSPADDNEADAIALLRYVTATATTQS